jgi:hypothetical protein
MMVPPPRLERGTSRSTISWTEIYDRFCSSLEALISLQIAGFRVLLLSTRFPWSLFCGDLVAI